MEDLVKSMNLEQSYNGKKVFVTGHTGFKGTWLITWLNMLGAVIKGYALAPEGEKSLYNSIGGDQICDSVIADIRDKEKLRTEILSFQPDFIFHLAAQPLVRLSYDLPTETFEVNAQGTANLLDAIRCLDKPCVAVIITTDKVYHNREINYPYKEDDRLGGYDPYSASKACAELIIDSYKKSFFNIEKYAEHQKSISIARAGNVIGGGDWAKDRIIPDIIRALTADRIIEVRNPAAVRPWQHVLEPLLGYLVMGAHQLVEPVKYAEAFNIGPYTNDVSSVEELVIQAIGCWGAGEYKSTKSLSQPHEAGLLQLDIDKALKNLLWKPKYNSNKAIQQTIEWYKKNLLEGIDARELTQLQITEFLSYG